MTQYRNPVPTVDVILMFGQAGAEPKIALIKRRNPPLGWALPGGFVNEGESFETAAVRETLEETGVRADLLLQFHTYSDPARDPRRHTATTVYWADASGQMPIAGDDAAEIQLVTLQEAIDTVELAFDHKKILQDFRTYFVGGPARPALP